MREAARAKLAKREHSSLKCGLCECVHWRQVDEKEWHPCVICGIRHGGFCYPWHGATLMDWILEEQQG